MANQAMQTAELLRQAGNDVRLIQVNAPYRPALVGHVKGLRSIFRLTFYAAKLWRVFREVDLVHVMANSGWSWHLFAAPAIWAAWLRSRPVVVNYRGGEAETFFARQWRWVKPTLDRADSVVVPSPFLASVFARREVRCSIIPNVLDTGRFAPRQNLAEISWGPHLVVTRNLERIYGISSTIRAFRLVADKYPEARMTIAGSGPEEGSLRALASELDLAQRIDFCGRLSNEEVAALYQRADLMLNASLEDNSPNSLIEALACGVPLVSTDAGGIPFLVRDRVSAMLVPVGNHGLLAAAALEVIENRELRCSLVRAGLEAASKFEQRAVCAMWQEEYSRLLSTRSP